MKEALEQLFAYFERMEKKMDLILKNQERLLNANPQTGNRFGGFNLAHEITGYKISTLRKMAASGEIPKASGYNEKVRFEEKVLREWMISRSSKTNEQIKEEVEKEFETLKRLRGKGN